MISKKCRRIRREQRGVLHQNEAERLWKALKNPSRWSCVFWRKTRWDNKAFNILSPQQRIAYINGFVLMEVIGFIAHFERSKKRIRCATTCIYHQHPWKIMPISGHSLFLLFFCHGCKSTCTETLRIGIRCLSYEYRSGGNFPSTKCNWSAKSLSSGRGFSTRPLWLFFGDRRHTGGKNTKTVWWF